MKLAIMQPYFLPYIGYYQLIAAVDLFIVYDNIKYTKRGWINRNRMLRSGKEATFSLPLKGASDQLNVCERTLAADFNREKLLNQFKEAYQNAPHFQETLPLLEQVVRHDSMNLYHYLHNSIVKTCRHLGVATTIKTSSDIGIDHDLRGQDKVLAICDAVGANTYINASGGVDLYTKSVFRARGIDLKFIRPKPFEYSQNRDAFTPWLSIVDVLMFNPLHVIQNCISGEYELF